MISTEPENILDLSALSHECGRSRSKDSVMLRFHCILCTILTLMVLQMDVVAVPHAISQAR